jgi:hypothetical protein
LDVNPRSDQANILQTRWRLIGDHIHRYNVVHRIASHADACSNECASTLIIDGDGKLTCIGCAVKVGQREISGISLKVPDYCNLTVRSDRMTCALPEHSVWEAFVRAARRCKADARRATLASSNRKRIALRFAKRRAAPPPRQPMNAEGTGDGGNARKDKCKVLAVLRSREVLCAGFPCGRIACWSRFYDSEFSKTAMEFVDHLVERNNHLQIIVYDDWCHLRDYIQERVSTRLRSVRSVIDRWHLKGPSASHAPLLFLPGHVCALVQVLNGDGCFGNCSG